MSSVCDCITAFRVEGISSCNCILLSDLKSLIHNLYALPLERQLSLLICAHEVHPNLSLITILDSYIRSLFSSFLFYSRLHAPISWSVLAIIQFNLNVLSIEQRTILASFSLLIDGIRLTVPFTLSVDFPVDFSPVQVFNFSSYTSIHDFFSDISYIRERSLVCNSMYFKHCSCNDGSVIARNYHYECMLVSSGPLAYFYFVSGDPHFRDWSVAKHGSCVSSTFKNCADLPFPLPRNLDYDSGISVCSSLSQDTLNPDNNYADFSEVEGECQSGLSIRARKAMIARMIQDVKSDERLPKGEKEYIILVLKKYQKVCSLLPLDFFGSPLSKRGGYWTHFVDHYVNVLDKGRSSVCQCSGPPTRCRYFSFDFGMYLYVEASAFGPVQQMVDNKLYHQCATRNPFLVIDPHTEGIFWETVDPHQRANQLNPDDNVDDEEGTQFQDDDDESVSYDTGVEDLPERVEIPEISLEPAVKTVTQAEPDGDAAYLRRMTKIKKQCILNAKTKVLNKTQDAYGILSSIFDKVCGAADKTVKGIQDAVSYLRTIISRAYTSLGISSGLTKILLNLIGFGFNLESFIVDLFIVILTLNSNWSTSAKAAVIFQTCRLMFSVDIWGIVSYGLQTIFAGASELFKVDLESDDEDQVDSPIEGFTLEKGESQMDSPTIMAVISVVVLSVLTPIVTLGSLDIRSFATVGTLLFSVYRGSTSLQGLLGSLSDIVPKCVAVWIKYLFSRDGPDGQVLIAIKDMEEFMDTTSHERMFTSPNITLMKAKFQLLRSYASKRELVKSMSDATRRLLAATLKQHRNVYDECLRREGATGNRPLPYVIYLWGPPGRGKSHVMKRIVKEIEHLFPHEVLEDGTVDQTNLVYNRNCEPFWNGYTGQPFVFIDDFGASNDDPNVIDFMSMVNDQSWVVPMATLDDPAIGKKGTKFISEFLLVSSNAHVPTHTTLNHVDAVARRRNLCLRLLVDKRFMSDGKVDMKKVHDHFAREEGIEPGYINKYWPHLVIQVTTPHLVDGSTKILGEISLEQLIHLVKTDFAAHKERISHTNETEAHFRLEMDFDEYCDPGDVSPHPLFMPLIRDNKAQRQEEDSAPPKFLLEAPFARKKKSKYVAPKIHSPAYVIQKRQLDHEAGKDNWDSYSRSHQPRRLVEHVHHHEKKVPTALDNSRDLDWSEASARQEFTDRLIRPLPSGCDVPYLSDDYFETMMDEADCPEPGVVLDEPDVVGKKTLREALRERWNAYIEDKGWTYFIITALPAILAAFATLAGVVYGIFSIAKVITSWYNDPQSVEGEAQSPPGRKRGKARRFTRTSGRSQMATSEGQHKVLDRAVVQVRIFSKKLGIYQGGPACRIKGRYIAMPYHYLRDGICGEPIEDEASVLITYPGMTKPIEDVFFWKNTHRIEEKGHLTDLIVVNFSARVPSSRDVRQHMPKESDLFRSGTFHSKCAWFDGKVVDMDTFGQAEYKDGFKKLFSCKTWDAIYPTAFIYPNATKAGDCGRLLVNPEQEDRFLVGMHTCNMTTIDRSVAVVFTQEKFQYLDADKTMVQGGLEIACYDGDSVFQPETDDHQFTIHGQALKKDRRPMPEKTTFVKSPLYERTRLGTPHATEPAILSTADPRLKSGVSPLKTGFMKYANQVKHYPKLLLEARDWVFSDLQAQPRSGPICVLPDPVVINGIDGMKYYNSLAWDTSPGHPYVLHRPAGVTGKKYLFTDDDDESFRVCDKLLQERYELRLLSLAAGSILEDSIWLDQMKDEKRPLAKIVEGKTRLFTIPPLDYVMANRKYFLSFVVHFYKCKIKTFSAVGINPESEQWSEIYDRMAEISEVGFDGDHSVWDGKFSPEMTECITVGVNRFYEKYDPKYVEADLKARLTLTEEMTHTPQLISDLVYETHTGMPSGSPLTVVYNTIANAILTRMCWLAIAPPELANKRAFDDSVRDYEYGDDCIYSVREDCAWFNGSTMADFYATLGMKFTPAVKNTEHGALRPIGELSFLKRTFGFHDDLDDHVPLMDKVTLNSLVNWVHKGKNVVEDCELVRMNVEDILRYAFFYGRKYFDEVYRDIDVSLAKVGFNFYIPNYDNFLTRFEQFGALPSVYEDFMMEEGMCQSEIVNEEGSVVITDQGSKRVPISIAKPLCGMDPRLAMKDQQWGYEDMLKKEFVLKTVEWISTDTSGTHLASFDLPDDIIVNQQQAYAFENFRFWRGGVAVRITHNGTQFHAGLLAIFFVPGLGKAQVRDAFADRVSVSALRPAFLYANVVKAVDLCIPYINPQPYVDNRSTDTAIQRIGSLHIYVFSQLKAPATISQRLGVAMVGGFIAPQPRVPRAISTGGYSIEEGVCQGNVTSKNTNVTYGNISDSVTPMYTGGDSFDQKAKNDASAEVPVQVQSEGENKTGNISKTEQGLDKPSFLLEPPRIQRRGAPGLNHAVNVDYSDKFTLYPSSQTFITKEDFHCMGDEMSISALTSLPAYVRSFEWKTSDNAGDSLLDFSITCMPMLYNDFSSNDSIAITFQDMIASYFQYWRGSFIIHVKIIGTDFHSGKLAFGMQPCNEASVTNEQLQQNYFGIVDLTNHKRDYTMEIPFNTYLNWLKVPDNSAQHTGDGAHEHLYSLGKLHCHVVNPLVAGNGVSEEVEVLVFQAGGADLQFAYPSGREGYRHEGGYRSSSTLQQELELPVCRSRGKFSRQLESMNSACFVVGKKSVSFKDELASLIAKHTKKTALEPIEETDGPPGTNGESEGTGEGGSSVEGVEATVQVTKAKMNVLDVEEVCAIVEKCSDDDAGVQQLDQMVQCDFVLGPTNTKFWDEVMFGEHIETLRDLFKKYHLVATIKSDEFSISYDEIMARSLVYVDDTSSIHPDIYWSLAPLANMFMSRKGGLRWKVFCDNLNNNGHQSMAVWWNPLEFVTEPTLALNTTNAMNDHILTAKAEYGSGETSAAHRVQFITWGLANVNFVEVETPFLTNYEFLYNTVIWDFETGDAVIPTKENKRFIPSDMVREGVLSGKCLTDEAGKVTWYIYMAFADESRLGHLLGPTRATDLDSSKWGNP